MRQAAVAGVGYTPFTRGSGCSTLELATRAGLAAIDDAGLAASDVDGVANFSLHGDSPDCEAMATGLGARSLRWFFDCGQGGQVPAFVLGQAALAVQAGHAETVVVFRALNGYSGVRVGSGPFKGGAAQYRNPIGYDSYLMYIAMWARRYLHLTGQGQDDLAAVALAQRKYAELNERALLRTPLTRDDYDKSRWVAEPFRVVDCTVEVDGACALVVTSLDRARDLRQRPVVVAASAFTSGERPGLDIGDQLLQDDYSSNFTARLREELFSRAGIGPSDVDFAEIYDCFTSTVLMGMEGLGFCKPGEAGAFIADGHTGLDGTLPVNTHGGLLSEGYLHGMNTVAEAVLQIQGRGGERQVPRHEVAVVTSGALADGSALVLTTDR